MIFQASHEGHLKSIDFFEKGRTSITSKSFNIDSKPYLILPIT